MIVVDRFEGSLALLDVDGTIVEFPRSALPSGTKEGSVILLSLGDNRELVNEATRRLERLRKNSPSGNDIEL